MAGLICAVFMLFIPSDLSTWYGLCAQGDWEAAFVQLDSLGNAAPEQDEILAAGMITAGLSSAVLPSIADEYSLISYVPDTVTTLTATAMAALLMMDDLDSDAMVWLENALEMDPSNTLAWHLCGLLNLELQRTAEADSCFSEVLGRDSSFLPARLESARILRDRGLMHRSLAAFMELASFGGPAGKIAMAEYVILADSLGISAGRDSLLEVLGDSAGPWIELARGQATSRPAVARASVMMISDRPSPEMAELLLEMEEFTLAVQLSGDLLLLPDADSTRILPILGYALVGLGEDAEAEPVLLEALERDPGLQKVMVELGGISERMGDTEEAVDYYLQALELDPFDPEARQRLRAMADDDYDPVEVAEGSRGLSLSAAADLSVEGGNRDLLEWGGNLSATYRFDELGTSIYGGFGGRSVTWEEFSGAGTDTLNTNRGWASLSADYWLSENLYLQASSSWDRQMYTERPWQLSSYLAGGWQKWILSWFWFSPRIGLGSVNTHWTTGSEDSYTDDLSVFTAAGLMYRKPYTFIRRAEISGSLYFPPGDPENFISRGSIFLVFRTWSPFTVSLAYSIDYTRSPEVSSWQKYNTSFTTSLNLDLY
jgi:tetratricopeptide (TPR) repeat protein